MKNTEGPLEDFPPAVWERIRKDQELLEAFQSSPIHLKAKARLREILSRSTSEDITSLDKKKNFQSG
jgi:hypothetical protein